MRILSYFTIDPATKAVPTYHDFERMSALAGEMREKGILIETGGRDADMLDMRIERKNGNVSVTDGPFAESKEVVGGYAMLEVKDREEAIVWMQRFLDLVGDATCYLHEINVAPLP